MTVDPNSKWVYEELGVGNYTIQEWERRSPRSCNGIIRIAGFLFNTNKEYVHRIVMCLNYCYGMSIEEMQKEIQDREFR